MDNTSKEKLDRMRFAVEDSVKSIVAKGASMQPAEIDLLSKAVCAIEKLKKIELIEKQIEFMENEYSENYSYARARSPITGRYLAEGYSSRRFYDAEHHNGYSGHSFRDKMIAKLEGLYNETQSEHDTQMLNNEIRRIQTNN